MVLGFQGRRWLEGFNVVDVFKVLGLGVMVSESSQGPYPKDYMNVLRRSQTLTNADVNNALFRV